MKGKKIGFSIWLAVVVSILLLAANILLGGILVCDSRIALKDQIDYRMLDIANTAADMLDGDVLRDLKAADADTPGYRQINDALAVFQDNIDLEYIYTIRDMGDGTFTFMVDPTLEDPGQFGDPIIATDALREAAGGTPAVDDIPYEDAWGRFYSAYSPVFDSEGQVAGIVAVDFSAEWHEAQMARMTRTIAMTTLISVILGVGLIFLATDRFRRQMDEVTGDIADVIHEVDDLISEINPDIEAPQLGLRNAGSLQDLDNRIRQLRGDLHEYRGRIHNRTNSMTTALSPDYHSVYYVDLDRNESIHYKPESMIDKLPDQNDHFPYREMVLEYAVKYVVKEYRDGFMDFTNPATIQMNLKKDRIATLRYLTERNGETKEEILRIARVSHPADRNDDRVHAVVIGFADEGGIGLVERLIDG